ncbi:MAG: hypothetical protein GWN58_27550 [Anaerolineae bacterium]|nr:hypothetical protein [Anaerolineae bacterium]
MPEVPNTKLLIGATFLSTLLMAVALFTLAAPTAEAEQPVQPQSSEPQVFYIEEAGLVCVELDDMLACSCPCTSEACEPQINTQLEIVRVPEFITREVYIEVPTYITVTVPGDPPVEVPPAEVPEQEAPNTPTEPDPTPAEIPEQEPKAPENDPGPDPTSTPQPEPKPKDKDKCNQGVGNGSEGCDPGNSNHNQPSNDEGEGDTPGNPGRKPDKALKPTKRPKPNKGKGKKK